MSKKAKYIVVKLENMWRVKDSGTGKFITVDCPKDVADEIADDFNKMDNMDYRPIGGPNASVKKEDINKVLEPNQMTLSDYRVNY